MLMVIQPIYPLGQVCCFISSALKNYFRDWLLITGRGGAHKTGGGGQVEFYPYEKGGGAAEKVLALLKGGGEAIKSFGVICMR